MLIRLFECSLALYSSYGGRWILSLVRNCLIIILNIRGVHITFSLILHINIDSVQVLSVTNGSVHVAVCFTGAVPPPNLAALSEEELRQLEGMERHNVEARIKLLQRIQSLLDSAVSLMGQYSSIAPPIRLRTVYGLTFI